jgi:trigger factor
MRASVEPVESNKVKLSVEVDEAEFEKALDSTYRKLARRMKVPGFRPGKAPRRLLEARLGSDAVRGEAIEDALPEYYSQAVRDADVDPIAAPEIDVTSGREGGPVAFDAVVEVRPKVNIAGYTGLRVTVPPLEPSEEDVDSQVDRLREQFATLSEVSRPARDKDHVTIDMKGYRHSESIEGMTADDYLYEVGSGGVAPELDDNLRGARPGDILKFNTSAGEGEVSLQVLVKSVKEKVLPEADDGWASEASEFETLEELREDIRTRLRSIRRLEAQMAVRDGSIGALAQLVNEEIPRPLVGQEMERRLHDLSQRLDEQGMSLQDYLKATGREQAQLAAELESAAEQSVRVDLALRAIADAESIEVTEEEVEGEIARSAERAGLKPSELRRRLERAGRLPELRSDMRSAAALSWLIEHVELVDPGGNPVDRAELASPGASDEGSGAAGSPQGGGSAGTGPGESPETVETTA